ncbi:hypothetical protein ACFLZM_01870 [Thermodesulfobacteriota bacterium]
MNINFDDFFRIAMGQDINPYPYQTMLAGEKWPDTVKIPTGLGDYSQSRIVSVS